MDKSKLVGILVLLVAFLAGTLNSILITNPSILDTNASTYVIVVMLMLPVMIIFSAKENLKLLGRPINLLLGFASFIIYIIIEITAMANLSFAFMSYRIDAFLWPLLLISLIVILFGIDGIKKLKHLIIYAIFASPVLLLPLFTLNPIWTNINSGFVYSILKLIGINFVKMSNTLFGGAGSLITISSSCVSLGTFVALIMFMIPVAYLYKGSFKSKALWVISGFILMVLFNILRIAVVLLAGVYYGLSSSILIFHLFAGQILFYIAIVIMLLIAKFFNLYIEKIDHRKIEKRARFSRFSKLTILSISIALAFGFTSFALSFDFNSFIIAPAISFTAAQNLTQNVMVGNILLSLKNTHSDVLLLSSSNSTITYGLYNKTKNSTIYAMITLNKNPEGGIIAANYSSIRDRHTILMKNGIAIKSAIVVSDNVTFIVNYFSMPYLVNGKYVTENYDLFITKNETSNVNFCSPDVKKDLINEVDTMLLNLFNDNSAHDNMMCVSYYIADSA
ncbi:MAG: exosortase/archaeosortase family protein [Candidatus Micrarchaeia archaeon]